MPSMPPTLGGRPRFERRRETDAARREAKPWRRWYSTARWKRRRIEQLRRQPLCAMHLANGEVVEATVADHVEPHRGDEVLFWSGELQILCKPCHDSAKQREERGGASG